MHLSLLTRNQRPSMTKSDDQTPTSDKRIDLDDIFLTNVPRRQMPTGLPLNGWFPLVVGVAAGLLLRLTYSGDTNHPFAPMGIGFMLFAPFAVGALTVYLAERQFRHGWFYYFSAAAFANLLFVIGTFLALIEGMICIIIAAPLFCIIGGIGGLIMGAICRLTNWPKQSTFCFVLLPLMLGLAPEDTSTHQTFRTIERSSIIAATPEQIWQQLHKTKDIQANEVGNAWMYKIGVPLPLAGVTSQKDGRLVRRVNMGKLIYFDQIASEWKTNEFVHWQYQFYEDSFPANALDEHVKIGGAYFDLIDTRYTLKRISSQATELKISMQYRVSTGFNWYAIPVAQLLIGNFEDVILKFYQRRSESNEG